MKKTKVQGIVMISSATSLIALVIVYTIIFTVFGLKSGGSIFILLPLILIAIGLIAGLAGLFYTGIEFIKKK